LTVLTKNRLTLLGWDADWAAELTKLDDPRLRPARVGTEHRGAYVLLTEEGDQWAVPTGRLRLDASQGESDLPAVGDWVGYRLPDRSDRAIVQAVLPRRTKFSRKTAFNKTEEQVLAANVDVVFLTTALPDDLNLRRLERYIATAWESGAEPVIVLTKADLADDVDAAVAEVEAIAFGVPVHAVSAPLGQGIEELRAYLAGNRTAVLLGSSGVGKTTLLNHLSGQQRATLPVRQGDDRGRHATSHRELVPLASGALVIDTPGLRLLRVWEQAAGLRSVFADIEELARGCRFGDCSHRDEPGCAVLAAIADGRLAADRLAGMEKLAREEAWLAGRRDARTRLERKQEAKRIHRAQRRAYEERGT
jgi:ribosome biogenesis GTPase / thiamine phosphate phosphatase